MDKNKIDRNRKRYYFMMTDFIGLTFELIGLLTQ